VSTAQDVFGTVRDSVTGAPVRGAVVMVLGANRQAIERRLTSSSGSFSISTASGVYVRVIRIAYLPFERRLNQLGASPLVITMVPAGRMIEAVSIRTNPTCPRRSDQRQALSLWSSATDALLAMVVATADSGHTGLMTQIMYDRVMAQRGPRILRQSTRRVVTGNVLPIRADRDPEEFVQNGYVTMRPGGATYYAPDPEILLDSSFAATHCLSMRGSPRGDTTRIGVAFAPPYNRRSLPDIEGVLWLNRNPLSLHSMEFEYRSVPQVVLNMFAGGRLVFETLSDGVPMISSWQVRSPRLGYLRDGRPVVAEIHETGGLIADGVLTDGTSWSAPLATLRGRVSNIVTNEPVPNAVVSLDSTDQRMTTDSVGRFFFDQLLPGPYVLRVRDSVAVHPVKVNEEGNIVPDSAAVMQMVTRTATTDLNVQIGFTPFVETALPWRQPVLGCGLQTSERRFVVIGVVVRPDSTPVPNVPIRLSWADTTSGVVLETTVDARSDKGGGFIVCGIPSDRTLRSRVVGPDGRVHTGPTRITRVNPSRNLPATLRAVTLTIPGP
jgi:hypothetical protein